MTETKQIPSQLHETILQVARIPHSIRARVQLSKAFAKSGDVRAEQVWEATVRAAIQRGQYFTALALCKLHLEGTSLARLLTEFASAVSKNRPQGQQEFDPPKLPERKVKLNEDPQALLDLAFELAIDIRGIGLPPHSKVPAAPLFHQLTEIECMILALEMEAYPFQAEHVLIEQDANERSIYILSHGTMKIRQQRSNGKEVELATVDAPAILGEMSMLTQRPRRASVIAQKHGMAWRIDEKILERLRSSHPRLETQLQLLFKTRALENAFDNNALFADLDYTKRRQLYQAFESMEVSAGEKAFEQGIEAPGLFLILHGEAEVWTENDNGERTRLARMSEGEAFGEFSLLTGAETSAEVLLPTGGTLLYLSKEKYQDLLGDIPQIEEKLRGLMQARNSFLQSIVTDIRLSYEELDETWIVEEFT